LNVIRIAHDALILVGDGEKAIFLRNQGNPPNVKLAVEHVLEQENPATRDQGSDRPGRTTARVATRRSAMGETDWHRLGEDRFASEIAASLYRLAHANHFAELVVIAPPKALGELRKAFHPEVAARVAAEIPKELTSHTVNDIEQVLSQANKL
jgi:protein required for attachment to host cells